MTHPALTISEKQFQELVNQAARAAGWLHYHPFDSRRSTPGFPDLTLVHPLRGQLVFAELKTERGKLTKDQHRWQWALEQAGCQVYLWRPSDWPAIEAVLTGRKES